MINHNHLVCKIKTKERVVMAANHFGVEVLKGYEAG
jgi:hypothetical protein